MTTTTTETKQDLQGISFDNFINAIKSPATRKGYESSLRRYLTYLKLKKVDTTGTEIMENPLFNLNVPPV
jgi:hypothetical protein